MTALPPSTNATGAAVTEGEFKTFISDLRAFLAGLLGTDGVAATARATLGVPEGSSIVQSFNSRTGAVTLSSGDVTVALGYTPANLASAGSDHNHSGVYAPMTAITGVSTFTTGENEYTDYYLRFTRANGSYFDIMYM